MSPGSPAPSYDEVVLGRRSVRGVTSPIPVPRTLIEEVIALAMRAPSSLNTQPGGTSTVVTGAPLDAIRAGNTERNLAWRARLGEGVPGHGEYVAGAP